MAVGRTYGVISDVTCRTREAIILRFVLQKKIYVLETVFGLFRNRSGDRGAGSVQSDTALLSSIL
jgi:hypothetical protein